MGVLRLLGGLCAAGEKPGQPVGCRCRGLRYRPPGATPAAHDQPTLQKPARA